MTSLSLYVRYTAASDCQMCMRRS